MSQSLNVSRRLKRLKHDKNGHCKGFVFDSERLCSGNAIDNTEVSLEWHRQLYEEKTSADEKNKWFYLILIISEISICKWFVQLDIYFSLPSQINISKLPEHVLT